MKATDQFEPATLGRLREMSSNSEIADLATISAAISLKRIADVLDRIAPAGGGLDPFFFEQAAYTAGQAFERGRR